MVEQVVRGRVTVKGVTDILKIFQQHYGKLLPNDTKMPSSWYRVHKLASQDKAPPCVIRDVCPVCDWLFPQSADRDPTCGRCEKETRWHDRKVGEAVRQAAYFDIEDDFRTFFEVECMADALEEFATKEPACSGTIRDRQLDAAVDGSIVHDLHFQEEDPGLEASDEEAAEVEDDYEGAAESSTGSSEVSGRAMNNTSGDEQHEVNTKFVCYRTTLVCANTKLVYFNLQEPYEGKFRVDVDDGEQPWAADQDQPIFEEARKYTVYLSLTADATDFAKWVNKSFTPVTSKILNLDCTLRSRMSNIQLHAVLPESIRDYNSLLRPVIIQLNRYRPRGGRPIQIHHPRTGRPMHLYVHLAYTVNDMRGVPGCTGGSHPRRPAQKALAWCARCVVCTDTTGPFCRPACVLCP